MATGKRKLPPLSYLQGFEAAARHLSFTRAAEELAVTQSAVSKQVKGLETHLGLVLLERGPRSLALTPHGERLYQTVHELVHQLDRASHRLHADAAPRQVAVTASSGFASLWLIPRLARFSAAHPGIDVRLSASSDVVNLEQKRLDLAVRYCLPAAAPEGAIALFKHTTMPVCAPTLLKHPKFPLRAPKDLERHVLLHCNWATERNAYVDWTTWLSAAGLASLRPQGSLHFNQYEQVVQAALLGQGVALGIDTLIGDLLRARRLVAPFQRALSESRNCFIVRTASSRARPEVDAFIAWLRQEADAGP